MVRAVLWHRPVVLQILLDQADGSSQLLHSVYLSLLASTLYSCCSMDGMPYTMFSFPMMASLLPSLLFLSPLFPYSRFPLPLPHDLLTCLSLPDLPDPMLFPILLIDYQSPS